MSKEEHAKFDLTERTAVFGENLIAFLKQLPVNDVTGPLIRQVVRSGTSIGANYSEADEAGSKKQFRNFISICKRESKETKYWLRMVATTVPDQKSDARRLWKEADELNRIFAAIHRNSNDDN
ncbi:MAG: four helix bundle protein [Planctomycetaceae bacterium]|nr:four helix bundle protein [Planctomycetaceae bacterium]MCB9941431.1 four helix bundle protein [Planctomycetaceae bacterium]HRX80525.1 four helix bundle protein [Pirellulaceae bacterium]